MRKKLPVGIDGFAKIRTNDFYYVDKTMFIAELLGNWGEVNLFTRPRRFGKSLNMSMLKSFFEIGCDKSLFDGLEIYKERELCEKYMGQFPVISITLKGVAGNSFEEAREAFRFLIGREARRFPVLLDSDKLTEEEKKSYHSLIKVNENGSYSMSNTALETGLADLSYFLTKHYGVRTIVLIDEYDVPLDKAFQAGYYDEMITFIRNMFGNILKSNDFLQFAVLTGCLRISKESIFTGMNNLKIHTITDVRYNEYFGFTDTDVKELLKCYHLSDYYETIKEWYNGYQFGNVAVYCPWDVLNYCDHLLADECTPPGDYWSNTSSNSMIRRFIDMADQQTRDEIEQLIEGESIIKEIHPELTYNELDSSIDNLWSVLFTTGYLTARKRLSAKKYELAIPNLEICNLFISQIKQWFNETSKEDTAVIERFCSAFPKGDVDLVETLLDDYLWKSISIRDTAIRTGLKENFYHGMLLGLLNYKQSWKIKSNAESGEGYGDILIETPDRIGVVVELKYADNNNLDKHCREALDQIEEKKYDAFLIDDGMKTIVKYGIAFYKKNCKVMLG